MMKKKVLHVLGVMGRGGVETMVIQLCNNLNQDEFETSIFSYTIEDNIKEKLDKSVQVYSLGFQEHEIASWKFYFHFITIINKIIRILRRTNPDIIHIHTTASRYLLISILSLFFNRKAKFIKTVHTSGYILTAQSVSDKIRLFVEKIAVKIRKTHVVGISKQVDEINKHQFINLASSFSIIYNGIDTRLFNEFKRKHTNNNNMITVCYVARVVPGKNHVFLINLWEKIIKEKEIKIQLLFVGDGILLTSIKKIIIEKQLDDYIICLGVRDDIPQILNTCDFAVFPSEFEGFGIALIEKMAAHLPVIVSDIPPFREIITNGKNGFIVDLKNEIEWIDKIILLTKDEVLRNKVGFEAYERSLFYSIEKMANQYENLYLTI